MADSNEADVSSPRKPTEKEALFFLTILGAMKNKPEVDWNLVAERAGYSNANTAKVRFGQIKKSLGFNEDGSISATATATTPKSTPRSRGKKVTTIGSGTNETPTKVTKKRGPAKKKVANTVKAEEDAEVDDEKMKEEAGDEISMEHYASHENGYEHVQYYDNED